MKEQQSTVRNVLIVLGIVVFLLFVWPTLYVYVSHPPDLFRVSRLTGRKEKATRNGWKTEEIEIGLVSVQSKMEQKIRQELGQFHFADAQELGQLHIADTDFLKTMVAINPTTLELITPLVRIEYSWFNPSTKHEELLYSEEYPLSHTPNVQSGVSTIKDHSRMSIEVPKTLPSVLQTLPPGSAFHRVVIIKIRDVYYDASSASKKLASLDPPFVLMSSHEFRTRANRDTKR